MVLYSSTLSALALLAIAVIAESAKVEALDEETARIVGGQPARQGQFPYVAALHRDGRFTCTASIISQNYVLTAAHCVESNGVPFRAEDFYVIAGNVNRSSPVVRIEFSELVIHPEYRNLKRDIAFFRTKEPIAFSDNIQPVCLAHRDTHLSQYTNATAMGWGSVGRRIPVYVETLMHTPLKIMPHITCRGRYPGNADDSHICGDGFGRGICYGDSGGPFVHLSANKRPVQIGIASFINAAAGCGSIIIGPGVYTRVSFYIDWLKQATRDNICTI